VDPPDGIRVSVPTVESHARALAGQGRRPLTALCATLAVQACATLALVAPSVLAPVVAPLLGLPAERIGLFVGIAYLAAMFSGLFVGRMLSRAGPVRLSGFALLASGAGLALGATGTVPALLIAAVLIGAAYGVPNPTAALLLGTHAPPDRRGLFFSIKQAGVPLGVGIAGLLVPALLGVTSWQASVLVLAALCAVLAFGTRGAAVLDRGWPAAAAATPAAAAADSMLGAIFGPLKHVMTDAPLRRLAMASLVYSLSQLCFLTFLVSYLKLERGYTLVAAAAILSFAQMFSIGARVFWGQVADRWIPPGPLLGLLGLAMGACLALMGLLPSGLPTWIVAAVAAASAATVMSWNGVYYAELVRLARPSELASVTGGMQFMTFSGAMIGPVAFAAVVSGAGSYGAAYVGFAVLPALIGVWLLRAGAPASGAPASGAPPAR
jgi:MFS family permease